MAAEQLEPFELMDLQQAYWTGRSSGLGGTACHAYLELDCVGLDLGRLEQACDALVRRHPMLRTIFTEDGRQRVLPSVPPYRVRVVDAVDADAELRLAQIREEMSHQVMAVDQWPLFDIRVTEQRKKRFRLHISFDVLIADAASFRLLAGELVRLYHHGADESPAPAMTFRDYVQHVQKEREGATYRQAQDYWRERVRSLPPAPELPLAQNQVDRPRFGRWETSIAPAVWQAIRSHARARGASSATVVLAAFAETLSLWAGSPEFTLNLTRFDRPPVHQDIDRVVGPFTSTTLLGLDLSRAETFEEFAGSVQRTMWEALEHRAVSGVAILRELTRHQGRTLMPYVFTYVQGLEETDFRSELSELGEVAYAISQTPQVLVDCQVSESEGGVGIWWDCAEDAFPPGMLDGMFAAFVDLLIRLQDPRTWVQLRPAAPPEAAVAVRRVTERTAEFPLAPLQELVLRAAAERPDAVAVVDGERRIRYAELVTRAVGLAQRLREEGVAPGDLVGVSLDRGIPQVTALLAVQLAGGAYLPIDPTLPQARACMIAELGGIRHLVTDGDDSVLGEGFGSVTTVPALDTPADDTGLSLSPVDLADLAYVIFTSGSTGTPKGVAMQHGATANTLLDINERFRVDHRDRVLAVSSVGFDLSVWDVFGILAAGGTVVLTAPGAKAKDPLHWLRLLTEHRITVWNSAPALLGLLLELPESDGALLPDLRLVMLSGDWIPLDLPQRIRAVAPQARVVSLGGATEAAVWSVAHEIDEVAADWTSIPYGRPLTNQTMYVLDQVGRERPIGVAGELYIGGVGLAKGYWNAPELTAAAFLDHPVLGRIYRTGDHARRLSDGTLEFLGRADGQVKIQGHRIELGEVDAALLGLPNVRAAVTEAVGPRDGHRQLVSYVVSLEAAPDQASLRQALGARLPSYMVPAQIRFVPDFPLNVNGKIDRGLLRELTPIEEPAAAHPLYQQVSAPLAPIARFVLAAVRTHLGDESIGPTDDLLTAGVDSINLVRLATVMERELGFRPGLAEVMRQPTAAAIADLCETRILDDLKGGLRLRPADVRAQDTEVVIADPLERARFRRDLVRRPWAPETAERRPLAHLRPPTDLLTTGFGTGRMTASDLEILCGALLASDPADPARRGYPTPGGIAAVRTYLWVREGRIADVAGGLYVVDPVAGELIQLDGARSLDPEAFDPLVYQESFREAAFTAILVGHLPTYQKLYGPDATLFAAVEAGAMTQALVTAGQTCTGVVFRSVPLVDRGRLDLGPWLADGDEIVHVLLGGTGKRYDPDAPADSSGYAESLEYEEGVL
ncbi:non-ribosomal peptide synthetase [Kitasatospora griseola]|uniref:non-ribosomal peptide synthetase n=1 Tax=Kitasatospora griseola TaxID=2064 RepID=UPI0034413B7F